MISVLSKPLKSKTALGIIGFLLGLALILHGISNPAFNWDMIAYVAAAHHQEGLQADLLHRTTYSELQASVPPDVYKELTEISTYRKTISENSEALSQQLPFYTIRMAYLWTMRLTSKLFPISLIQSTYFISSFFSGLCLFLLFTIFKPNNIWLLLFFPILILVSDFPEMAALSTPDAMASFFACMALIFYQKNKDIGTTLILAVLPLIRTDFIILAGLISICSFLKKEKLQALLYVLPPLLVYFAINKLNANYGYLKVFNFTLIGNNPFPATLEIKQTLEPYLNAYRVGFSSLFNHRHFVIYIVYLLFWLKFIRPKQVKTFNEQVFIILGFVGLHMILFPAYFPRFFSWCAAIAGLQLARWIYELRMNASTSN